MFLIAVCWEENRGADLCGKSNALAFSIKYLVSLVKSRVVTFGLVRNLPWRMGCQDACCRVTHEQQKLWSRGAGRCRYRWRWVELLSSLQKEPGLSINTYLPVHLGWQRWWVSERAPYDSSHGEIPCVIKVWFMRALVIHFLLNDLWGFSLSVLGKCLEGTWGCWCEALRTMKAGHSCLEQFARSYLMLASTQICFQRCTQTLNRRG